MIGMVTIIIIAIVFIFGSNNVIVKTVISTMIVILMIIIMFNYSSHCHKRVYLHPRGLQLADHGAPAGVMLVGSVQDMSRHCPLHTDVEERHQDQKDPAKFVKLGVLPSKSDTSPLKPGTPPD